MTIDRRLHPRAVVRIEGSVRRAGSAVWERSLIQDLSATGVGVRTAAPLELQTMVAIRFRVEGSDRETPIEVEADCMVVRTAGAASPVGFAAIAGLHFLNLEPDIFEAVRVWVWDHLHPGAATD